ncbi:hypothetical protein Tco_0731941 [Tanacetum coccineum]
MGDENPIRTLGDYSKPSHKGYMNTIQLPIVNNMVPLQSDTIRLVQNGCSIHDFSGPHDTQYCMEDPKQAIVEYASSRTDEAGEDDGELMFIEIIRDDDEPQNEDPDEGEGATTEGPVVEYFDTFPTRDELTYHKYLM